MDELFQQFLELIRIPTLIGAILITLNILYNMVKEKTTDNPERECRLVAQVKPSTQGRPLEKGCSVHLHWNGTPVSDDSGMFILYRVNEQGEPTILCSTEDFCWTDSTVSVGETYTYRVKTVGYWTRDGKVGEKYSNKVVVKIG